ncbi:MAG: hypothetical protein IKU60_05310 [Clostridia bacterium]|nr:hypothetical protein [Clostridia bacterium]
MNKFIFLFLTGGFGYTALEILWRGYTHWSMFILGGFCLYILFSIFNYLDNTPLLLKAIIGGGIITVTEFITGYIVNILLGWNVWNYSSAPYNILGQVCLPYSLLWIILSIPIALSSKVLGKYVR